MDWAGGPKESLQPIKKGGFGEILQIPEATLMLVEKLDSCWISSVIEVVSDV